jgi:hypothetical protein
MACQRALIRGVEMAPERARLPVHRTFRLVLISARLNNDGHFAERELFETMRAELDKLKEAGKIDSKHIEPLLALVQGGYCSHKSWGFGRITTVDTVFCLSLIHI